MTGAATMMTGPKYFFQSLFKESAAAAAIFDRIDRGTISDHGPIA